MIDPADCMVVEVGQLRFVFVKLLRGHRFAAVALANGVRLTDDSPSAKASAMVTDGGLSVRAAAERCGIHPEGVRQALSRRRREPTEHYVVEPCSWFAREERIRGI